MIAHLPAMSAAGEAIVDLLFGWYFYLARVLPRVSYEPVSLMVAGAALVLFMIGIHLVGRKVARRGTEPGSEASRRWRWRTTVTAVAGLIVLFAAGISLVSLTHQGVWLVTTDGSLTVKNRSSDYTSLDGPARAQFKNNIKQISLAVHNYHDVHQSLPQLAPFNDSGQAMHSWMTRILPFVPYSTENVRWHLPWRHPEHRAVFESVIHVYVNPSLRTAPVRNSEGYALSHLVANSHVLGPAPIESFVDITDGTSNTILYGEVNTGFRPWGDPVNWRDPGAGIASTDRTFSGPESQSGTLFGMADGSVKLIGNGIDPTVLKAIATPAGGDRVPLEAGR